MEANPPQTTAALKQRVKNIWEKIPQSMLKKMAKSMQKRLKDVIVKEGGFIVK